MNATEHPRPLLRRPWTSLDGEWDFAADPDLAWERPGQVRFDRRIVVPFAPQTPASGLGSTSATKVWYRRPLPPTDPHRRTVLYLGAVDRVCDVWVGGEQVARHEGGWTSVDVDVTAALETGRELVVRADDDPIDLSAPRGKQDWWDEPHFIFSPRTTGIWRSTWLEQVDASSIGDVQLTGDPLALTGADGAVLDEVLSYTALRTVGVEDPRLVVNRRPVPLRLVLDQGYWPETGLTPPDGEALRRDLELTRALGFTGAREHQKTEDPRYLAWADRMGMLVWVEMPSAYRGGPLATERLLREWAQVVQAYRGHPSVVAWVPVNESWGVEGLEDAPRARSSGR